MKIVSWNLNKATAERIKSWEYLLDLQPDIALLQEVNSIPDFINETFDCSYQKAIKKGKTTQNFGTAILVKGNINNPISLVSQSKWVNEQLNCYTGIFVSEQITLNTGFRANVVSVHSPAWCFDSFDIDEIERSEIKLKNNSKIWGTELLWSALTKTKNKSDLPWIVGGDFNMSTLFDQPRNRGNQEVLDRMKEIDFEECLFKVKGEFTPTFRNVRSKELLHQLDRLFVSPQLIGKLKTCEVGEADFIFENRLSDHLPIIADFDIWK